MFDTEMKTDLLDALFDLKHDLGKYVYQPVGMLPLEADSEQLRGALGRALHSTRNVRRPAGSGTEVVGAKQMWDEFLSAWVPALMQFPSFAPLQVAVEEALGLERLLEQVGTDIERESVQSTLKAVGNGISNLILEVEAMGVTE